jgi:hypothetical protein
MVKNPANKTQGFIIKNPGFIMSGFFEDWVFWVFKYNLFGLILRQVSAKFWSILGGIRGQFWVNLDANMRLILCQF